jgi:hypothetical protein
MFCFQELMMTTDQTADYGEKYNRYWSILLILQDAQGNPADMAEGVIMTQFPDTSVCVLVHTEAKIVNS